MFWTMWQCEKFHAFYFYIFLHDMKKNTWVKSLIFIFWIKTKFMFRCYSYSIWTGKVDLRTIFLTVYYHFFFSVENCCFLETKSMSGYALYKVSGKSSILLRSLEKNYIVWPFCGIWYDIDRNEIIIVIQGVPYG